MKNLITTRERRLFHSGSLGFLVTYGIPGILILHVWLGTLTGYPNLSITGPLIIAYVIVPLVQSIWPKVVNPVPDTISQSQGWSLYYRVIPLLIVPLQLVMLSVTTAYWTSGYLNLVGNLVLLLTTGLFSGMFAINGAHELIHSRQRLDRWLGGFLLSTVCYGTFKIVHLRVHHRYVGTAFDFQTAQRGQSIYNFWIRSLIANGREAIRCERQRVSAKGRSLWTSELVLWYGLSAVWLGVVLVIWGLPGGLFFLAQSLIAILKLEWMNYLQHYGLSRKVNTQGHSETVALHHSWSHASYLHNLALLNLFRHSDHHVNPNRPYQTLRHFDNSPQYPYNFAIMILLSLFPPLFRRVVHPYLGQFEGLATDVSPGGSGLRARLRAFVQRRNLGYQIGLIGFAQLSSLLRLAHYAVYIHPRYFLRFGLVLSTACIILPLRLWERLRYGRKIARLKIDKAPVFIIGHWRSGTTHLHNLMAQDPSFGYISMYQAMVPNASLAGGTWLKKLLGGLVPRKRPMDNMEWPMEAPQEEEIPLSKVTPYGFYVRFLFPQKSQALFQKHVLLEGASPRLVRELKKQYRRLLQVATLHAKGKRLLLKNPVNTGRLRFLLDLFPDAKFIHIHRSPYDVFASTRHLHRKLLDIATLQHVDVSNTGKAALDLYEIMMKRLFEDRTRVPNGNFVEVRYEDLERDPLMELRRVYEVLGLPGYADVEPAFRTYVASQKDYQKNHLELSADEKREIEKRWAFAFKTLGYPLA